ncbi:MAG: orotidine-5'-phosphate decarboxylase, partial [Planctomycetota bacterium]
IDLLHNNIVGVKPQSAFYEKYGPWGFKAFFDTMIYAKKKNLIVIADVKRGDVPSTAQAYAEAYLGKSSIIDAITVNPLLGRDSLDPFIKLAARNGQGLFVLVKTSNPGSKDFQDQVLSDGQRFYETVAQQVVEWGKPLTGRSGYSGLGAVVGATFPDELKKLRSLMPHNFFLIPGYGAQGGQTEDIKSAFNPDGLGALITAARSIIYPASFLNGQRDESPKIKNWPLKVEQAAGQMNREINTLIT